MPKRVLVADDERHIVRLVEVNLQRCGYAVLTAYDQETALQLARQEQPDLVVVDADWAELRGRLAADPRTAHIELVVLSDARPRGRIG